MNCLCSDLPLPFFKAINCSVTIFFFLGMISSASFDFLYFTTDLFQIISLLIHYSIYLYDAHRERMIIKTEGSHYNNKVRIKLKYSEKRTLINAIHL